jgi:predicted AAA+ superfamily ATPase
MPFLYFFILSAMIQNILDEALIERKQAMGFIKKFLHTPLIKVLTGQRRVGKSSILKLFIQHFYTTKSIPLENFFYINKENMEFDHIKTYEDLKKEFQHFRKQIVP